LRVILGYDDSPFRIYNLKKDNSSHPKLYANSVGANCGKKGW